MVSGQTWLPALLAGRQKGVEEELRRHISLFFRAKSYFGGGKQFGAVTSIYLVALYGDCWLVTRDCKTDASSNISAARVWQRIDEASQQLFLTDEHNGERRITDWITDWIHHSSWLVPICLSPTSSLRIRTFFSLQETNVPESIDSLFSLFLSGRPRWSTTQGPSAAVSLCPNPVSPHNIRFWPCVP